MTASRKRALLVGLAVGVATLLKSPHRSRLSFRDKSVLITGGSRGLGLEIARRFAREGAHVTILGRNKASLEAAARELEHFRGGVLAIPCDIRNQDEVQAAVREVLARWGQIDVLVNNAESSRWVLLRR